MYPECVLDFSVNHTNTVDIGSQTYDYVRLAFIQDYKRALEEVRSGKQALDDAGSINSTCSGLHMDQLIRIFTLFLLAQVYLLTSPMRVNIISM